MQTAVWRLKNSCFYSNPLIFFCLCVCGLLCINHFYFKQRAEKHAIGCIHMETGRNTSNNLLGPCSASLAKSTLAMCPYPYVLCHQKCCYFMADAKEDLSYHNKLVHGNLQQRACPHHGVEIAGLSPISITTAVMSQRRQDSLRNTRVGRIGNGMCKCSSPFCTMPC